MIVFNALDQTCIRKIVLMHLTDLERRIEDQGYHITVDTKAVQLLGELGFDPEYGARPVRRVIQERVEDEIAEEILKGVFNPGDTIRVVRKNKDQIVLMHGAEEKTVKEEKDVAETVEVAE